MRRYTNPIVLLWGAGGGALSNTFFVSLFSYFTFIFTFTNYSSYNILIKFLEFNYLDYWILLSISLIHFIFVIVNRNNIGLSINYIDDITYSKIIYHIIFVTALYIIGTITKFNIFIFWAINHIIIELLLLIYLNVIYINTLYKFKTIQVLNLSIINSLIFKKDQFIYNCKTTYRESNQYPIIDYIIALNYSYAIIGSYINNAENIKYTHYLVTAKNSNKHLLSSSKDINEFNYLPLYGSCYDFITDKLLNIKSKNIINIIISIIKTIISK